MAFLRSISTTTCAAFTVAVTASLLPSFSFPRPCLFSLSTHSFHPLSAASSHLRPLHPLISSAHRMDSLPSVPAPPNQLTNAPLPQLLTEFMVDMKCDGCVSSVKNKLLTIDGVKSVEADLTSQVVRVYGNSPVKNMTDALEQGGRKARLIGQGVPEDFLVSAAVAEFKGPLIFGVVRFAQVSMELARFEASFSGLSPGRHSWSINEYGDLTRGAASTGKVYNPSEGATDEPPGDLGTLDADDTGNASLSGTKERMRVVDLIGRSIVVYAAEDNSVGISAAVIARSAGVGENYKKVCLCDGTTIWESTNADFVTS